MRWWDEGEEELPADAGKMHKGIHASDISDIPILIFGWVQHAGGNELRVPCCLFLILDLFQELSKDFLLLFALGIGNDINNMERLLRKFSTCWFNI